MEKNETPTDPVGVFLGIVCWILPLAGLVFGPGAAWQYLLWLAIGTIVLIGYDRNLRS